jgi:hypothetical protein
VNCTIQFCDVELDFRSQAGGPQRAAAGERVGERTSWHRRLREGCCGGGHSRDRAGSAAGVTVLSLLRRRTLRMPPPPSDPCATGLA